jgi:hypothetical protein
LKLDFGLKWLSAKVRGEVPSGVESDILSASLFARRVDDARVEKSE